MVERKIGGQLLEQEAHGLCGERSGDEQRGACCVGAGELQKGRFVLDEEQLIGRGRDALCAIEFGDGQRALESQRIRRVRGPISEVEGEGTAVVQNTVGGLNAERFKRCFTFEEQLECPLDGILLLFEVLRFEPQPRAGIADQSTGGPLATGEIEEQAQKRSGFGCIEPIERAEDSRLAKGFFETLTERSPHFAEQRMVLGGELADDLQRERLSFSCGLCVELLVQPRL